MNDIEGKNLLSFQTTAMGTYHVHALMSEYLSINLNLLNTTGPRETIARRQLTSPIHRRAHRACVTDQGQGRNITKTLDRGDSPRSGE